MPLYYLKYAHEKAIAVDDPTNPAKWRSVHEASTTLPDFERVFWAEQATVDNPLTDHEANAIPEGDYAITRSDGVVFASERDFFEATYAPVDDLTD